MDACPWGCPIRVGRMEVWWDKGFKYFISLQIMLSPNYKDHILLLSILNRKELP